MCQWKIDPTLVERGKNSLNRKFQFLGDGSWTKRKRISIFNGQSASIFRIMYANARDVCSMHFKNFTRIQTVLLEQFGIEI